ncbi:hypothetical protein BH23CHL4_BH23CHL4_27200 [soil metagenome]
MSASNRYQDPEELFDLVGADGTPLGRAKSRAAVHRDGDWHRALHVWVYGERDTGPFMIFQRRGLSKDTNPGALDAMVGGHFGAGEPLQDVMREVQEEIGIPADLPAMRKAGVRISASEKDHGAVDRELQDVFLWRRDEPLAGYRPNTPELEGLAEARLTDVLAISAGTLETLPAQFLNAAGLEIEPVSFGRDCFAPAIDRYIYRVAIAIQSTLRGEEHVAI